jgi:hypothetical protein
MPESDYSKRIALKQILREGAVAARKYASDQVLEEAARQLEKRASVTKRDLEFLGETLAHDPEIFAVTDIGDINDVLDQGRKP